MPGVDADRRCVIGDVLRRRSFELAREMFGSAPCPDERVSAEQPELDGVVQCVDAGDARLDPTPVRLYFFLEDMGLRAARMASAFLRIVFWLLLICNR